MRRVRHRQSGATGGGWSGDGNPWRPMTSRAERFHQDDIRRWQRVIDAADSTDAARDMARTMLERLDPTCPHCLEKRSAHNGAVCPVLARFQRRAGKGLVPTPDQAAELRRKLAEEAADEASRASKADAKERQGKLF